VEDLLRELAVLLGTKNVFCYADDLMFVSLGELQLESAVRLIIDWGDRNGLRLNPKKCAIMRLRARKVSKDLTILPVHGIAYVDQYKYLGIIIDSSLTMDAQHKHLKQRVGHLTSNFYKMMASITGVKLRLEMWKVYVKPLIEYCVESYILLPSKLSRIETLYYQTIKQCLSIPKKHSKRRYYQGVWCHGPKNNC